MGKASRDKGARGEREVAAIFRSHGVDARRTPNSGGLHVTGDLIGADGLHVEVKWCETLRVPAWLRQAHDEAPAGTVPLVAFRRNGREAGDVTQEWHAIVELDWLIAELCLLAELRRRMPPMIPKRRR